MRLQYALSLPSSTDDFAGPLEQALRIRGGPHLTNGPTINHSQQMISLGPSSRLPPISGSLRRHRQQSYTSFGRFFFPHFLMFKIHANYLIH